MPEGPEIRIMSDFINKNCEDKIFKKSFHVQKGNNPEEFKLKEQFKISAETNGKELVLNVYHDVSDPIKISVFMGMSGNWKWVRTSEWNTTKFIRLRFDTIDGWSLILYGLYMGPKYKIGGFSTKRGPDSIKDFYKFKSNILDNLDKKIFDKPICEVILDQNYFNGVGNYLRSTILYYLDINPFQDARTSLKNNPEIIEMCRDTQLKSYQLNGGQLKDWRSPFDTDYEAFREWVYYQKGKSCKDGTGRTFWYHPKWDKYCIYLNKSETKQLNQI